MERTVMGQASWEDIVEWDAIRIRSLFESHGLLIQEWDKVRTDWLTLRENLSGARDKETTLMEVADA